MVSTIFFPFCNISSSSLTSSWTAYVVLTSHLLIWFSFFFFTSSSSFFLSSSFYSMFCFLRLAHSRFFFDNLPSVHYLLLFSVLLYYLIFLRLMEINVIVELVHVFAYFILIGSLIFSFIILLLLVGVDDICHTSQLVIDPVQMCLFLNDFGLHALKVLLESNYLLGYIRVICDTSSHQFKRVEFLKYLVLFFRTEGFGFHEIFPLCIHFVQFVFILWDYAHIHVFLFQLVRFLIIAWRYLLL